MRRFIDLSGQRFGRWTVLNYEGNSKFRCLCDCGTEKIVSGDCLRRGKSRSCGCYAVDLLKKNATRHGGSRETLYYRWRSMRNRCNNKNAAGYHNYGGRGIYVCDEWNTSYDAFKEWAMKNGYSRELTVERIDNDGPYSPENCRFATKAEQARNRRDNRFADISGDKRTLIDWAKDSPVCYMSLLNRVNSGVPIKQAVEMKPQKPIRDPATGRFVKTLNSEVM